MDPKTENAMTIADKLGIDAEEAALLLEKTVHIVKPRSRFVDKIPQRTAAILSRTFDQVEIVETPSASADLVLSWGEPTASPGLVVCCNEANLTVAPGIEGPFVADGLGNGQQTIAACYIAAAATQRLIPGIADNLWEPLRVPLGMFSVDSRAEQISIGDAFLIGAGAIGNGFVWALEDNHLTGQLTILDQDKVKNGNLQRNILCRSDDIGDDKVNVLARHLSQSQPLLNVNAVPERTESVFGQTGRDLRIERLISGVDSPRARRALQKWLPREVFDASTSGTQEVIFYHDRYPLDHACLECVYPLTPDEKAHERHVADALGVPLSALSDGLISEENAELIISKYPDLTLDHVVGEAYDSLFKRLCGAQKLQLSSGSRVLAPLAFVSILAGAVLAVEFQNRIIDPSRQGFNFWRLSPWSPPMPGLRRCLPKNPVCQFCSTPLNAEMMDQFWGHS